MVDIEESAVEDPDTRGNTSKSGGFLHSAIFQILTGITLGVVFVLFTPRHMILHYLSSGVAVIGTMGMSTSGVVAPITNSLDSYYDLSTNETNPMFYGLLPDSGVNYGGRFELADLEYTLGEVVSLDVNGNLSRRLVDLQTPQSRDALFADTLKPAVFVISSSDDAL